MARKGEMHSESIQIDQKPTIRIVAPKRGIKRGRTVAKDGVVEVDSVRASDREGDVIVAPKDKLSKEYLEELNFMNDPVTIRLEPSREKNAASVFPVWVNGEKAPVLMANGKWMPVGWLPVGMEITIRRSALEIIARAKVDSVETDVIEQPGQDPENRIKKFTSPVHSFSIIEDANPRGREWLRRVRQMAY